jgi:hypothetical protein
VAVSYYTRRFAKNHRETQFPHYVWFAAAEISNAERCCCALDRGIDSSNWDATGIMTKQFILAPFPEDRADEFGDSVSHMIHT